MPVKIIFKRPNALKIFLSAIQFLRNLMQLLQHIEKIYFSHFLDLLLLFLFSQENQFMNHHV